MTDKNLTAKSVYVVILATLLVALALIISMFCIVLGDREEPYVQDAPGSDKESDTAVVDVVLDNTPLFPTRESRTSYIIPQSDAVKTISDSGITSEHAILVDLSSYSSVAEKAADDKIYPASMTKVMTLIVACERVTNLSEMLTVTEEITKYAADNEGSGVGLKIGDKFTVEDLLYLVSYQSDTIASLLIADHIAGSEAAFVELMNDKAKELGLTNTNFANCTGLYNENNYTTCREMASIMAYALDNELAYRCLSSYTGRKYTVGGVDCIFYCGWYSQRFKDNPKVSGGKIIAGKTGYTDESGYTLASCAEIDGKRYINVIITRTDKNSTVKVQEGPSADQVKYIYKNYK